MRIEMASFGSASSLTTKQCETSDFISGIISTQMSDSSAPVHYVLEINSFSMMSSNDIDKFESNEFDAGGYKWKLILYPKGDENTANGDHVSLHVALSNKTSVKIGQEIYATVRFSVFDQVRTKYFTKQGGAEMFHRMKPDWGISNFMPLNTFTYPSSGYLVDDKCLFGVGVFVIKSCGLGDTLTLEKSSHLHEWKITNFSRLGTNNTYSEEFKVGNYNWNVRLYPSKPDDHLQLYLLLKNPSSGRKVRASYTFRLKGRDGVVHKETKHSYWFGPSVSWGSDRFMSLKEFRENIVDDYFIIETDVAVLAEVSKLA